MSLSLTLYLALSRHLPGAGARPSPTQPRPDGALVWLHASDRDRLLPLLDLIHHLLEERGDLNFLLTGASRAEAQAYGFPDNIFLDDTPAERPQDAAEFLSHWQPDILIWAGGCLRPALIAATGDRSVPMVLVDARFSHFPGIRLGWLPGLSTPLLRKFDPIYARDYASARALIRQGAAPDSVQIAGDLQEGGAPPPCEDADRNAMATHLDTRPIWLALGVCAEEAELVIATHQSVSRLSHRLLLVLAPRDAECATRISAILAQRGWAATLRSQGDLPGENTRVCIADEACERGLWLRLAPVTFMGGTLGGDATSSPYQPAALGSAIVHGPRTGAFETPYQKLDAAGAARLVQDQAGLEKALETLLAPDKAAVMAGAAWELASTGAEVTDRATAGIMDVLDRLEIG